VYTRRILLPCSLIVCLCVLVWRPYLTVGQVFATKSDLLPPQYVAALKSVFDACPPVCPHKIRRIVEAVGRWQSVFKNGTFGSSFLELRVTRLMS